ncbi:unnamed protein product, partial [Polarella glacialis]
VRLLPPRTSQALPSTPVQVQTIQVQAAGWNVRQCSYPTLFCKAVAGMLTVNSIIAKNVQDKLRHWLEHGSCPTVSSNKIYLLTVLVNNKRNSKTSNKQQKRKLIEEKCYWNQPYSLLLDTCWNVRHGSCPDYSLLVAVCCFLVLLEQQLER